MRLEGRFIWIFFLLFIMIASVTIAKGELQVSPLKVKPGESIKLIITDQPGQIIDLAIKYTGDLDSSITYNVIFSNVKLTSGTNSLDVKLGNIVNLTLTIRYGSITYIKNVNATSGTASLIRSNIPAGSYTIKANGHSIPEEDSIPIKFKISLKVETDSNGNYTYTINTKNVPPGTFTITAQGQTKQVQINTEDSTQSSITISPPSPPSTSETLSQLEPSKAAELLENLENTELRNLDEIETQKRVEIIDQLSLEKQLSYIKQSNPEQSAVVLDLTNLNNSLKVFNNLKVNTSFKIIPYLGQERITDLLFSVNHTKTVSILTYNLERNLTFPAVQIENMVKDLHRNPDKNTKKEKTEAIREILAEIRPLDRVLILTTIARLPHTPSTVAEILEIMDTETLIETLETWIITGDPTELETVLDLVSVSLLTDIHDNMNDCRICKLLDSEKIKSLPDSSGILVNIDLVPARPSLGEDLELQLLIENMDDTIGHKTIRVFSDDVLFYEGLVWLEAGEIYNETISLVFNETGEHILQIGETRIELEIPSTLTKASIEVVDIFVDPEKPYVGENVSLTVKFKNIGGQVGLSDFSVLLNKMKVDSISVTLEPNASLSVTRDIFVKSSGNNILDVGGASVEFVSIENKNITGILLGSVFLVLTITFYLLSKNHHKHRIF